jgi:transcriptional regulator with XRE-family HTH domain
VAKIDEWLEQDKLILLEGWARDGLTEEQIAKNMGISVKTLYNWKTDNLPILQALKKGKEVVDIEVENALLKRALGYTVTLKKQKVDKEGCVHDLFEDVHVPGDTTAQIFWLKNRKKQQWRDKFEYSNDNGELNKLDELLKEIKKDAIE